MNELARGIYEAAQAIGADPVDLATVISYETAGSFDPTQRGPTTQWGQHRGLIQFGEPQARQYGVDWSDPVGSQLGANGAVARYFRENGYRPGMGMLDLYSTVNAGAPGRYNASDANNGGAPGSVRDKVEGQMADHRRNAERMLGFDDLDRLPLDRGTPDNALAGGYASAPAPDENALRLAAMQQAAQMQPQFNRLDPAAFQSQRRFG